MQTKAISGSLQDSLAGLVEFLHILVEEFGYHLVYVEFICHILLRSCIGSPR
jgi:hypothetical protein